MFSIGIFKDSVFIQMNGVTNFVSVEYAEAMAEMILHACQLIKEGPIAEEDDEDDKGTLQ